MKSLLFAIFLVGVLSASLGTVFETPTTSRSVEPCITTSAVGNGNRRADEPCRALDPVGPTLTPTPTVTPDPYTHLPFYVLYVTPTPTITPTATPSGPGVTNGGFEQGHTAWAEYSVHGFEIILHESDLPVPAHNGSWATWFGGEYGEASIIEQVMTIPHDRVNLNYWLWIASQDICNPDYDIAGVLVNDEAVDAYLLCTDNNTGGWISRSVNFSDYAGHRVTLTFAAFTDNILNSNLFVDDVAMHGSTVQTSVHAPVNEPAFEVRKPAALIGDAPASAAPLTLRMTLEAYLATREN